jgi:phospholipid transport system substrate-binding protein
MKPSRIFLFAIIAALVLTIAGPAMLAAAPPEPLEAIKGPVNTVIAILNDPAYKDGTHKAEQRDKIWQSISAIFDFNEISMRAVARNWRKFSPEERKDFAAVFSKFLGNTYVDKIQGEYHNEQIVYVGQEIVKEGRAVAKTIIKRESLEIPVDYRLKLMNGKWRVYDVAVEGISLVKNYRTQFTQLLKNESPAELIKRLKKKLAEQES